MIDNEKPYYEFDLRGANLLPNDWVDQVISVATSKSYMIHLDGKSSTSREPDNSAGSDVFIVDGVVISEELSWLHSLYGNELLSMANRLVPYEFEVDSNLISGININYLKGGGSRYEWHVDSNPLTGLLFVTSHGIGEGGELVFRLQDKDVIVHPKSGVFLLFDARNIPHTVLPLQKDSFRISIPMNFFIKGEQRFRPHDLDQYIYQ